MDLKSNYHSIRTLLFFIEKKWKFLFIVNIVLMFSASFFELFTLAVVFHLTTELFQTSQSSSYLTQFEFLGVYETSYLLIISTMLSFLVRIVQIKQSVSFSEGISREITNNSYFGIVSQPYLWHLGHSYTQILSDLSVKSMRILPGAFSSLLNFFSSLIILIIFIFGTFPLVGIYPFVVGIFVIFLYLIILKATKQKVKNLSKLSASAINKINLILKESLAGIRETILYSLDKNYKKEISMATFDVMDANVKSSLLSNYPRYFIESLIFIVLAVFMIIFSGYKKEVFIDFLPELGSIILLTQKLLPSIQNVFKSFVSIGTSSQSVYDVKIYFELDSKKSVDTNADFSDVKEIKIASLKFHYPKNINTQIIINNLTLKSGEWVGVIGASGSGKSTFLDVISGLIFVQKSKIYFDKTLIESCNVNSVKDVFVFIPQSSHIFNASISFNISLSVADIDYKKMDKIIKIACLEEYVNSLKNKLDSKVGEDGSSLSGGLKQRIGIARALYRGGKVMLMDEASSALDEKTKNKIFNKIKDEYHDLLVIMVSHDLGLINNYTDKVIKISNGHLSFFK